MAEAVVFYVLEKIGDALAEEGLNLLRSQLGRETSVLPEIKDSMTHLKSQFNITKAFLAEQQNYSSQGAAYDAWLDEVKNVAHKTEDVIDEFTYLTGQTSRKGSKLMGLFRRSTNLDEWHEIARQLKQIEVTLQKLMSTRELYGISVGEHKGDNSLGQESYQELWSDSTYFDTEEDIFGNKEEKAKLNHLLMHGPETRNIIAICGMGGIGKTTLARGIYKNKEIENAFNCRAWITMSQKYKVEDLLRGILRQVREKNVNIHDQIDTMDRVNLVQTLRSYLQDKKYLVMLDDMWSRDAWALLNHALPENNIGSRIVITTRIEGVASIVNNDCRIGPKRLPWKDAWDLFCHKAFQRIDGKRCPEFLNHLVEKIIQKCDGLPLAIVVIGSLLNYTNADEKEWNMFYSQLSWHIDKNPELNHLKNILSLSFNSLPGNLKNCFMYCCLFPEDYLIRRKRIIRLWIAEGFVEERGAGTTLEEVAEEYLQELVHRSLLQVVERNQSGRAKGFQMHDIVREITIARCRSERFSLVAEDPRQTKLGIEARRVSVLKGAEAVESAAGARQLRSFLLFDEKVNDAWFQKAFANFRLLTVLSLEGANIEKLPDIVTDLFNLNYLDLKGSKVKEIPKSIGKLRKLQLLNIEGTNVMELPGEIRMLTKLRLLRAGCAVAGEGFIVFRAVRLLSQIYHLNDLQVLGDIVASEGLVDNLGKLTQLRSFGIFVEKIKYLKNICTSIRRMPNLVRFGIVSCIEELVLDLDNFGHVPSLEWLRLRGKLHGGVALPMLFSFTKLTFLSLEWSRLQVDPLPSISHMSNLGQLSLQRAYDGQLLTFRAGWFPKLKELHLIHMEHLNFIEMEAGTMQNLDYVQLIDLRSMITVSHGFQHLTSVQKLVLADMPEEFIESARGEDWVYIQHIPSVVNIKIEK